MDRRHARGALCALSLLVPACATDVMVEDGMNPVIVTQLDRTYDDAARETGVPSDLLKAIGQLIRSTIRGEDVGFRCGGDEFVVLLPGSTAESGQALADRLVSLVDALGKTIKLVAKPPRLAVGLATLLGDGANTPQALLASADRALYEVKRARKSPPSPLEGLNPADHGVQSPPLSRRAG